jgi:hypothetical protein
LNKIIFTQDVPGEREWINSQFPGYVNFESEFGGKWPPEGISEQNVDAIWEIPPDSTVDVSSVSFEKIKSQYQPDTFINHAWCNTDRLLSNLNFKTNLPRSTHAQVVQFSRSGTRFLESILFGACGYQPTKHVGPSPDANETNKVYQLIENLRPDIFINYRNDWWGFATSYMISKKYGYYHCDTEPDWSKFDPFEITRMDMDRLRSEVCSIWNFLCGVRTKFTDLNFYIIEFDNLIKHQQLTTHTKLKYNKNLLISNYFEAAQWFQDEYLESMLTYQTKALHHLTSMNCTTITDFKNFL